MERFIKTKSSSAHSIMTLERRDYVDKVGSFKKALYQQRHYSWDITATVFMWHLLVLQVLRCY